jgi:hypothetical protein
MTNLRTKMLNIVKAALAAVPAFIAPVGAADSAACTTVVEHEKPAMELGGFLTTDFQSPLDRVSGSTLSIGEVDLGAKVNISDEVVASVVVKSWNKLDSLWIDQALASFKPSGIPVEFIFGQQTLSFGLVTTRLISFPLIYNDVDLRRPSLVVNGSKGIFTVGLGLTYLERTFGPETEKERLYDAVITVDAALPNESNARLSSRINKDEAQMDIAGTANAGRITLDVECLASLMSKSDSIKPSGFYAGLLWNITEKMGLAVRFDGCSGNEFKEMNDRIGGGFSCKIKDGIYGACELSRSFPNEGAPSNQIAFELGLQQKIELPGFQRKTLGRE